MMKLNVEVSKKEAEKKSVIENLLEKKYGELKGGAYPCGAVCRDCAGNDICNVSNPCDSRG